jgi:hypothetical protein
MAGSMKRMPDPIGYRRWAIAEGRLSEDDDEAACILNASADDAHIALTVYFADREPGGPFRFVVPARRTLHMRFGALTDPERIPRDADYSSVIESDVPVVVQHSRADASTIAYAGD